MKFDNRRVSTRGVDDLRGTSRGKGVAVGGGAGLLVLAAVLVFNFISGGNVDPALVGSALGGEVQSGTGESAAELEQRCSTQGAIQQYNDCFLIKIYNETDEVWSAEFAREGLPYEAPRLAFFTGSVSTGCGPATADVGPFYCPPDERMYFDLDFLLELQDRFGAEGRYAQAYILAHEFGHHLQTLLGAENRVRQAQQRNPSQADELSIALELQADCYAGVWGRLANDSGNVTITDAELTQAQQAAAAVGDDRIQQQTTGRINPDTWT
ncbi:MAG: neutral zinc metallopeptidase, partial [Candidatus Nanopelagicales bacterium]